MYMRYMYYDMYYGIQLHFECYNKENPKYSSFKNSNVP